MIKHYYWLDKSLSTPRVAYLCNFAVKPTEDKLTKRKCKVTCRNCLRILIQHDYDAKKLRKRFK